MVVEVDDNLFDFLGDSLVCVGGGCVVLLLEVLFVVCGLVCVLMILDVYGISEVLRC